MSMIDTRGEGGGLGFGGGLLGGAAKGNLEFRRPDISHFHSVYIYIP